MGMSFQPAMLVFQRLFFVFRSSQILFLPEKESHGGIFFVAWVWESKGTPHPKK